MRPQRVSNKRRIPSAQVVAKTFLVAAPGCNDSLKNSLRMSYWIQEFQSAEINHMECAINKFFKCWNENLNFFFQIYLRLSAWIKNFESLPPLKIRLLRVRWYCNVSSQWGCTLNFGKLVGKYLLKVVIIGRAVRIQTNNREIFRREARNCCWLAIDLFPFK